MRYGELWNIVENNLRYTDKDLWVGTIKDGYERVSDGEKAKSKKEATKKSGDKGALFFSSAEKVNTRYLIEKKLDGVPATLFGFLNIVSSRIGEENLLKSPIVIFDDGRVFIMKNYVDYRNDSRMEQDIAIPRDWYSSAWVSFWEPMDAKSIRTPDGEFAVDVMERYLKKLEVTGYDKIRANTVNNRGSRTACTVMKQIMKLSRVQEPFTRCEQLKNAYDIEDGYYWKETFSQPFQKYFRR